MPTAKYAGRRLRGLRASDCGAVVGGIGVTSITPSSWSFGMRAISVTRGAAYFNEFVCAQFPISVPGARRTPIVF